MTQPDAFLRAIAENLYDDAPRLIFADWLEEQGDPERAEFIRLQCELEPMRDKYEIDRAAVLHRRENELLANYRREWFGQMPLGWDDWQKGVSAEFRRGFVDIVSMPVRTFLELGSEIRQLHPTIRRVVLFRVNSYGERLASCSALEGVAELELACWYSDADAGAIAASPYLSGLHVLEIWLGRRNGVTDSRLCQILAAGKAWPRLRELSLLNPNGEEEVNRRQLVTEVNQTAGRNIAVYCPGYPELFPFAADYWYTFPGFMPDGRSAMASEDHTTTPPTLCVITFDSSGNQTEEVLTVPLPSDLLAIPAKEWHLHGNRMKQHLMKEIGFKPGFIRIRGCQFPWDEWGGYSPCRGHDEYWEDWFGFPDVDNEESLQEYPGGIGRQISWLLREGQYILGWDRWADKRGEVHST